MDLVILEDLEVTTDFAVSIEIDLGISIGTTDTVDLAALDTVVQDLAALDLAVLVDLVVLIRDLAVVPVDIIEVEVTLAGTIIEAIPVDIIAGVLLEDTIVGVILVDIGRGFQIIQAIPVAEED